MIEEASYRIGVLTVSLQIPGASSLKAKRGVLKSLKERIRNRFNVSIAEVGQQNKWQVSVLAIVNVGNDGKHLDSTLQNLLSFIEKSGNVYLCEHDFTLY